MSQITPVNEFNLHIGPDSEETLKVVFEHGKKRKVLSSMFFMCMALALFILIGSVILVSTKLAEKEKFIAALEVQIDELNEESLMLGQELKEKDPAANSNNENVVPELVVSKKVKVKSDTVTLAEEGDETFDFLILGTNGAHTDTIMIASVNKEKNKVTLFSVPRDLYINGRRINEYYTYFGTDILAKMLKTVTGLTIDKYVQVDLNSFIEVVDILGGIDIYVEKGIYDGLYPNSYGGYSAYSIEVGEHHMDGTEALKYARSRYSTNDFDRAGRQQKIVQAVRTELLQMDLLSDFTEVSQIIQSGIKYVTTDISLLEAISYYYNFRDFEFDSGLVLTTQNYLYSTINENGAYTLLPRTGNFDEIQDVILNLVNN